MSEFTPFKDEPGLKCLQCNHFQANIYLFENHTAYPNCGDQTCVSAWYMNHQIAQREMERDFAAHMAEGGHGPMEGF